MTPFGTQLTKKNILTFHIFSNNYFIKEIENVFSVFPYIELKIIVGKFEISLKTLAIQARVLTGVSL